MAETLEARTNVNGLNSPYPPFTPCHAHLAPPAYRSVASRAEVLRTRLSSKFRSCQDLPADLTLAKMIPVYALGGWDPVVHFEIIDVPCSQVQTYEIIENTRL